jgi:hypothetical protein
MSRFLISCNPYDHRSKRELVMWEHSCTIYVESWNDSYTMDRETSSEGYRILENDLKYCAFFDLH